MTIDIKALEKAIEEDMKDPNGYWNTLEKIEKTQQERYNRFDKWLETNDFEELLQRLLKRNGDERADWCRKKGCEKYPTPMMQFVFDYISDRLESIDNELMPQDFSSGSWFFKGYWFQLICGLGCFWRIYDGELNIIEHV